MLNRYIIDRRYIKILIQYCIPCHITCWSSFYYITTKIRSRLRQANPVSRETDSLCNAVHGGRLALPHNTQETEVMNNGAVAVSEIQVAASWDLQRFYINVHDRNRDGVWTTIDGEEVTHFDWYPDQPDNHANKEYCVILSASQQKHHPQVWFDISCGRSVGYICETSVSAMNFRKTGQVFECGVSFCPTTGMKKAGISQLECARLCGQDSSCRVMTFDHNTSTCVLAVDGSEYNTNAAIEDHNDCCIKI